MSRPVILPKLQINETEDRQGILASEAIAQLVDQITRHVFAEAIKGGYLNSAIPPEGIREIKDRLALDYIGQAREFIGKFGVDPLDRRR